MAAALKKKKADSGVGAQGVPREALAKIMAFAGDIPLNVFEHLGTPEEEEEALAFEEEAAHRWLDQEWFDMTDEGP